MPDHQTDWTHGSDDRGARPLMESLMAFDLPQEVAALRAEPAWTDGDRNARTLAKSGGIRVLLVLLRDGVRVEEQNGEGPVTIQLVEGAGTVDAGGAETTVRPGVLTAVEAGTPWSLSARGETAALITFAWTAGAGEA